MANVSRQGAAEHQSSSSSWGQDFFKIWVILKPNKEARIMIFKGTARFQLTG